MGWLSNRLPAGSSLAYYLDQDGAPVGRVGAPPDQVPGLQRVHDLGGGARCDLQAVR